MGATGKRNVRGATGNRDDRWGRIDRVRADRRIGRRSTAAGGGRVTASSRGLLEGHERPMIPRCASVSGRPPRPPSGPPPAHGARSRRRGRTRHPVPTRHAQGHGWRRWPAAAPESVVSASVRGVTGQSTACHDRSRPSRGLAHSVAGEPHGTQTSFLFRFVPCCSVFFRQIGLLSRGSQVRILPGAPFS